MLAGHRGFTLVEVVIAILIGTILTSIAMASFGGARSGFAVRGAKQTFAALHARTRAQAIENGQTVIMIISAGGDSALITRNDTVLESYDFRGELNVDVRAYTSRFRVCMGPQGYGDETCSSSNTAQRVQFWYDSDSTSVIILPLGQLVGM